MINATVAGTLGRDAELRAAGRGHVCSFSVASEFRGKDCKQTIWVSCSLWGPRGEKLQQYLTKGSKVAVGGELTTREHNGKTYLELNVQSVELMGGGQRRSEHNGDSTGEQSYGDCDLPF